LRATAVAGSSRTVTSAAASTERHSPTNRGEFAEAIKQMDTQNEDMNEQTPTIACGRCAGTGRLLDGKECDNCDGRGKHRVEVINVG
jgi:DnaJ-class molecular chaperone